MKIEELMTKDVVAVRPETSLKDVATLMAERGISGVPVVHAERVVLGVVSEADILVKEQGPEPGTRRLLSWILDGARADSEKLAARTAGEAMTSPAITVRVGQQVHEAARSMTERGIKRLPVVDDAGSLVGIVTRADLVRAFSRSDADIEREIREDVVRDTLWIEDEALAVRVERGEVMLAGQLHRRSDAEILPRFVARVPGVVAVRSELEWAWDDRRAQARSDPYVPIPSRR